MTEPRKKSNKDWKKELPPDVYHVTREKGTEAPFTGKYVDTETPGMYTCFNCGAKLFSSETKFHSDSGWPSFTDPANLEAVELRDDNSMGMQRKEVMCKNCGAHLGHVFDDGPEDKGGKRYCINSYTLKLEEKKQQN